MMTLAQILSAIKTAIYGRDVRQAIHDGIKRANDLADSASSKQAQLQQTFDGLVINAGNSNAEIVVARGDYPTLADRLKTSESRLIDMFGQTNFVEWIANNKQYNGMFIKKATYNTLQVCLYGTGTHITYSFIKDPTDDFYKLGEAFYGKYEPSAQLSAATVVESGTYNTATDNHYTTVVGDSFTGSVFGSNIKLRTFKDNRGGIWEITVDSLPPVTISTWSEAAVADAYETIMSGLPAKTHTIKAVFKGADPSHAPAGGTARGWLKVVGGAGPLYGYGSNNRRDTPLLNGSSNKEFAFSLKYGGQQGWVPEHDYGAAFAKSAMVVTVNDSNVDWTSWENGQIQDCKSVALTQSLGARMQDGTEVATINIRHSVNMSGKVDISGVMKATQEFDVALGYPIMLPANGELFDLAITSKGEQKLNAKDDVEYFFPDSRDITSAAFLSTTNSNFVVAAAITAPYSTMLMADSEGVPSPDKTLRIWQRALAPKIYWTSMQDKHFSIGDTYRWSGQISAAFIQRVLTVLG